MASIIQPLGNRIFPSVIDVLLGSLRFALNAFTRQDEKKMETAERLLKLISPLFVWGTESGRVLEISFILSPKVVKVDEYKERYHCESFSRKPGYLFSSKSINHCCLRMPEQSVLVWHLKTIPDPAAAGQHHRCHANDRGHDQRPPRLSRDQDLCQAANKARMASEGMTRTLAMFPAAKAEK